MDGVLPTYVSEDRMPGTGNLLSTKIVYYFFEEFKERYWELRDSVLSNENIIATFQAWEDSIPDECYEEDMAINSLYSRDPTDAASGEQNNVRQITYFVNHRMALMDTAVRNMERR